MNVYALLADLVAAVHAAYILFVIFGLAAVLLGIVFRWSWTRNFWFRTIHLAMIAAVLIEVVLGVACPLTVWENDLRALAGQERHEESFIGRWIHALFFFQAPRWVFAAAYLAFGAAVLLAYVLAPPRWPGKKRPGDAKRQM